MKYLNRIADKILELHLEAFGAVQIKGPKWCGKTTTAEIHSKSVIKMQDPDKRAGYLATAQTLDIAVVFKKYLHFGEKDKYAKRLDR